MTAKPRTNLAKAYFGLDDKNTLACGFTDRSRVLHMILSNCQIKKRTWYEWMQKPAYVRNSDRFFLSLLFNQSPKQLFNPQLNIDQDADDEQSNDPA